VISVFQKTITTRDGREILLREPKASDLKEFLRHINQQVADRTEGINVNKKNTLSQERVWLGNLLRDVRSKKKVMLVFEHGKRIVGSCEVNRKTGRGGHIAVFGIGMEKEYRHERIATQAVPVLITFARKKMKGLKIIELEVLSYNKPAQGAYKKLGFRKMATLPDASMNRGKLDPKHVMYYYLK